MMAHPFKADDNRGRLLARLIREILATAEAAEFEQLADLVEALKLKCARHHIGWTHDDISAALRMVASNVALPGARVLAARRERLERDRPDGRPISRAEASAILLRLGVRL
jgi:hypothetical protein